MSLAVATGPKYALPIAPDLFEALASRAAELVAAHVEKQRWAIGVEGLAKYLRCSPRAARQLREKGLPARKHGKRLVFDLREVDAWLEREGS